MCTCTCALAAKQVILLRYAAANLHHSEKLFPHHQALMHCYWPSTQITLTITSLNGVTYICYYLARLRCWHLHSQHSNLNEHVDNLFPSNTIPKGTKMHCYLFISSLVYISTLGSLYHGKLAISLLPTPTSYHNCYANSHQRQHQHQPLLCHPGILIPAPQC